MFNQFLSIIDQYVAITFYSLSVIECIHVFTNAIIGLKLQPGDDIAKQ